MAPTPPPASRSLRASVDGRIGRLTLSRPEKRNPLGTDTLEDIVATARWFDAQHDVRVVVVEGQGPSFCGGADVGAFVSAPDDGHDPRSRADAGRRMADAVEAMRAVTVARIQGHCIGGGVVLAAACDLRVASEAASFAIPEIDLGIPLAWGGVPRLVREIGAPATRDLVMTCRTFGAAEAQRLGLVQRVVPDTELDRAVADLAGELAAKAALAVLSTKRHVDAVTSAMVGIDRSWADADGLALALRDPECRAAGERYVEALVARRTASGRAGS